mmetsp:Transcript_36836/g.108633  ORF Transcript_36836/g.108633 Transcript_36836/m.108633 type:complete len:221 (-) Transcript_36836:454-1116(-)
MRRGVGEHCCPPGAELCGRCGCVKPVVRTLLLVLLGGRLRGRTGLAAVRIAPSKRSVEQLREVGGVAWLRAARRRHSSRLGSTRDACSRVAAAEAAGVRRYGRVPGRRRNEDVSLVATAAVILQERSTRWRERRQPRHVRQHLRHCGCRGSSRCRLVVAAGAAGATIAAAAAAEAAITRPARGARQRRTIRKGSCYRPAFGRGSKRRWLKSMQVLLQLLR